MGTKMHYKSYFPYSMKDLNGDPSWPLLYGDKMVANGQCYNGFMPRALGYPGHDKVALKQKMLEHEAVFKNQVLELHRLYRIQRDMMEEFKRKDRTSTEPASSSSLQGPLEPRKWHMAGFPLSNSSYGVENLSSPASCTKGNNGYTTKNFEALDSRPSKVRKKLFDLQLPADEYVDPQEEEKSRGNPIPANGPESGMKCFIGHTGAKTDHVNDACASAGLRGSFGLADLNEPIHIEEARAPSSIDFLSHTSRNGETNTVHRVLEQPVHVRDGISIHSAFENRVNDMRWLSHANGAGSSKGSLSSIIQGSQQDKPSQSSHRGQGAINHVHHPPGMYSNGYNREEKFREGFPHGLESFSSGSYPFFTSSSFATSRLQSMSSWPHRSSGFTQKITALESYGNPVAMSRPMQSSSPCQHSLGGNWRADSSSKPAIDINLNEALPVAEGESKPKESLPSLHWLRPKPMHVDEASDTRRFELSRESSYRHASSNGSCSKNETARKDEIAQISNAKKILGFAVLERDVNVDRCDERRNGMIDINVVCEPDEEIATEEENKKKGAHKKDQFDLNSCVSDSEDPSPPSYEENGKRSFQIDLEAPLLVESEDEAFRDAAETLVGISSSPQLDSENTLNTLSPSCEGLLFLANAISLDQNEVALDSSNQIDEFEAMTLQLVEAKEEDCKAKPFLPELQMLEEGGHRLLHTRTRRGHARRGRHLRDFQKDILPGLASLSRQEVTEDIQVFGGLMRATGHAWNSGLTKRNGTTKGGGRGRRRVVAETTPGCTPLMEKLSSIGGGLDERSLKGWEKTTRRPRRQRCPAGSVATAVLTR